ncbi:MAG: hypothetical protein KDA78_07935 [Planctomycetaceae bacterium]|nr:hypothetical protein [Planctomycetaceae bacterium]
MRSDCPWTSPALLAALIVSGFLTLCTTPQAVWGEGEFEEGNRPQSAANYTDWPGLIDAINDTSRVYRYWVNGNEMFRYRGEIADLNRMFEKLEAVEVPMIEVLILPQKAAGEKPEEKPQPLVWELNIIGGIVKAYVVHHHVEEAFAMHPVLTVYASSEVDLNQVVLPKKFKVSQLEDRRSHYLHACRSENALVKQHALQNWEMLEKEILPAQDQYKIFLTRLQQIDQYLQSRSE